MLASAPSFLPHQWKMYKYNLSAGNTAQIAVCENEAVWSPSWLTLSFFSYPIEQSILSNETRQTLPLLLVSQTEWNSISEACLHKHKHT